MGRFCSAEQSVGCEFCNLHGRVLPLGKCGRVPSKLPSGWLVLQEDVLVRREFSGCDSHGCKHDFENTYSDYRYEYIDFFWFNDMKIIFLL